MSDRTRDRRVNKRENNTEVEIRREIVKNEEIVNRVAGKKRGKEDTLAHLDPRPPIEEYDR